MPHCGEPPGPFSVFKCLQAVFSQGKGIVTTLQESQELEGRRESVFPWARPRGHVALV